MSEIPPSTPREPATERSLRDRLLGIPLFYKLVLGNAAVLLVAVAACAWLLHLRFPADTTTLFAELAPVLLAALVVTALINAVIVRLALYPLRILEDGARRVESGDLRYRVPPSRLTDPDLERMRVVFNQMLDGLAQERRRRRELAGRALEAQEQERQRIAAELHDDTTQRLAALRLKCRLVEKSLEDDAVIQELGELRDELGEALESLRRMARGLRPPELDDLGVVAAIQKFARRATRDAGIELVTSVDADLPPLSERGQLALYRIIQEGITNAVRHADASVIRLRIRTAGDGVVATVEDDGGGIPESVLTDRTEEGLGIYGMRERAAYAGGKVNVWSGDGTGTVVRVEIPAVYAESPDLPPEWRAAPRSGLPEDRVDVQEPDPSADPADA